MEVNIPILFDFVQPASEIMVNKEVIPARKEITANPL
jgi:hypothetical protein